MLGSKNLLCRVILNTPAAQRSASLLANHPARAVIAVRRHSVNIHGVTDKLTGEDTKYSEALKKAEGAFREAESIFNAPSFHKREGWKKDTTNDWGDAVYSKQTDRGKMVAISTELEGDPDFVMKDIWKRVEGLPNWSEQVDYAEVVARPTDNFDIITYGKDGNILVSGRDYVTARIYRKVDDGYIMASKSVTLAEQPKPDKMERAQLHLAAARLHSLHNKPGKTHCDVVMVTDLKGMLPKAIVNYALGKMMLRDAEENQAHFHEIKNKKT